MTPDQESALKVALRQLKASDKLEAEVLRALDRYGFTPETTTFVLSFLKDRKFVDDRRTIKNHIEKRSGRRSIGKEKLRAELLGRGAPEDLLEECLAAAESGDELEGALAALQSRFRATPDRVKAGRFLASRGFDGELIESALDRFFVSNDRV